MARIRTIKPDAFISDSLNSVPRGTRWTFAGLWTYADDKGRGRDDARLIKAALYPLDDDVSLADVSHDIDLLTGIGAVCRYVVDGKRYLHMPNWHHQKINRPTPARSPECPEHEGSSTPQGGSTDDSVSPHGVLTEPSTWEKEGERETEQGRGTSTAVAVRDVAEHESAQTFVAEWIDSCTEKPPGRVIGQVAKELGTMLKEGIDPTRVRNGLAEWHRRGLHPSTLPSVVHELSTPQQRRGQSRNQETEDLFTRAAVRMGVIQGGQS